LSTGEGFGTSYGGFRRSEASMSVFVVGGTGFIGYRLVRLLVERGQTVTCMDSNPDAHSFADLGPKVSSIRGNVAQFEDVMSAMSAATPERVVNLAYLIGSNHAPHVAMRINVLGTDNCFEVARLLGVKHTVYAGSFAPNGKQSNYGDRAVTEDDQVHGEYQYARHKIMNEWQALDYTEKFGMLITGIRCAYVTGPDKLRGSVDHVRCITEPARGNEITLPFKDAMVCAIHVDDMAEVFARVLMAEEPAHRIYNSGGTSISLGGIADIVRTYLPDARIRFDRESGAKATNSTYLLDNSRLLSEFGLQYRPFQQAVLQIINDTRRDLGLPLVGQPR
jgi:nucleoside-diphosphate-sugar epimerase